VDQRIQAVAAELKHDCLIDLIVFDKDGLDELLSKTPLYRQVVAEGIAI
jgi:hypothetical protein